MVNSVLAKLLAGPANRKPPVKRQKQDHETHREHALRSQLDVDRRRHQAYLESQHARLTKLRQAVPQVDRYVNLLARIAHDTTAYSRRNCDQDLGDAVERLGLRAIPDRYQRYLLVEITLAWLADLAKSQKVYALDDADIWGSGEPETIDDVKAALDLT